MLLSEYFTTVIRNKINAGISSLYISFHLVEVKIVVREILHMCCELLDSNFCFILQQPHELHFHILH